VLNAKETTVRIKVGGTSAATHQVFKSFFKSYISNSNITMSTAGKLLLLRQVASRASTRSMSTSLTMRPLIVQSVSTVGRHTASTAATAPTITPSRSSKRFLGAQTSAAAADDHYAELVKETIKKMISERDQVDESKPISDDDLEAKFNYYKKVFDEAKLCLQDLREATPGAEDYVDECSCAKGAVNNAFTAYVDLLEDLRRANEEQLQDYREARNTHACNLKRLRQELDDVLMVPSDDSTGSRTSKVA